MYEKLKTEYQNSHIQLRAAALTYTTLFAILPLITLTFSIFSNLPSGQILIQNLQEIISGYFLPDTDSELKDALALLSLQATKLSLAGLVILLFTVVLLLRTIEITFNEIWGLKDQRPLIKRFSIYFTITFIGPFLLANSVNLPSLLFSTGIIDDIATSVGIKTEILLFLPLLFSAASFSIIYIVIPNTQVSIAYGFLGGTIVAIIFELARKVFGLFINYFASYDLIYGAFAFIPIFLMWMHFCWIMILTGLLLVKVLQK